jgi:hypothetical protein
MASATVAVTIGGVTMSGTSVFPGITDRYWLGVNTDWSDTQNWSTTDGGTGGYPIPTSNNDVYFTSTNVGNCTLTANSECKSLNIQSGNSSAFDAATFDMYVAGDIILAGSGNFDFGSGSSWLVDGTMNPSGQTGTFTMSDITEFEMTAVAAGTTYLYGFPTGGNYYNMTFTAGGTVVTHATGASRDMYGTADIYGTLEISASANVETTNCVFTVKNGGSMTGAGSLSLTPGTIIVDDGGSCDVAVITMRYNSSIKGTFDCTSSISFGNTFWDDGRTETTTVLGLTTLNCDLFFYSTKASYTHILDLATNSATLRSSADIDFSLNFTAGNLTINDAPGRFKLMGATDQSCDFGGSSVDLFANKWNTGTVTFDGTSDIINISEDSNFYNVVLDGPQFITAGYSLSILSGGTMDCNNTTVDITNSLINLSGELNLVGLAVNSITNTGSELYLYDGSEVVMGTLDQTFAKVVVNGDSTVSTTAGDFKVTNDLIVNAELNINGASALVMVFDCNLTIGASGTIIGTGTLYTRDKEANWFSGDTSAVTCSTWTMYDDGVTFEVPVGIYNVDVVNFWSGSSGITYEFSGVTTFNSQATFNSLGAGTMTLDFSTNGSTATFNSDIFLLDDSTGEIQADTPLNLSGTGNVFIDDERDTASTANHVMFTSNKLAGEVDITGTAGEPTVFTGTFSCGSFVMSGATDVDFNDCIFNCAGDMTLNNNIDAGSAQITIGGDYDYQGISSYVESGSLTTMTGVGKVLLSKASLVYHGSLTIAAGADISTTGSPGSLGIGLSPAEFRIDGHLTTTVSMYIRSEVYISSTGQWTLQSGFPQLYSPGSGSGLMQQDGIIDGNANLYLRGFVAGSIFAPGTYSCNAVYVYGSGGASYLEFDGEYLMDCDVGWYPDASYTTSLAFVANCDVTITGDVTMLDIAGATNHLYMYANSNVRVNGDFLIPAGNVLTPQTVDSTSKWTLYASVAQLVQAQGANIGQVFLSKPSGDTTFDNTICALSGTTNGDVITT